MTNFFHSRFPNLVKVEIEEMEGVIKEKRQKLTNEHIEDELEGWI
jgi:hypothetical protein